MAINKLQKNLAINKLQSFVIPPQVGTQLHQQVADYIQLIKQGAASVDLGNSLEIVGKTLAEELNVSALGEVKIYPYNSSGHGFDIISVYKDASGSVIDIRIF